MSSGSSDFDFALVAGFGAGLFFFFKGFKVYREYRVLADTPEMPIRSIPMGLVEIHGKAKGEQLIPSPVSKTPCFFYKVDIERWVKDKNGGHWTHAKTDANGVWFYLEDATGKVLVDAHGAEYDLLRTARRETGQGAGTSLRRLFSVSSEPTLGSGTLVSDAELYTYASSVASGSGFSFSLDGRSLLSGLGGGSIN